jgi:hypothetical protein
VESYAAWVVAESRRLDLAGDDALEPRYAAEPGAFPLRRQVVALAPEPLALAFLRVDVSGLAGGIEVELTGDPYGAWTATAVVVPTGTTLPAARVSLRRTPEGRAEVKLPSSAVGEVVVAVANLDGAAREVGFAVAGDDTFPCVLRRLDAASEPGGVRLFWETSSETDVLGWWVLRSGAPDEAFVPLNGVLVPGGLSLGLAGGSEYTVVDRDVEAGRTYFYYLEALTSEGLPASSHVVAVTVPR